MIDNSSDPSALVFTGGGGALNADMLVWLAVRLEIDRRQLSRPDNWHTADQRSALLLRSRRRLGAMRSARGQYAGRPLPAPSSRDSGSITVGSGVTVTMNPGTYVFTGNLGLGGHGTLTGTGVTLYFPGGTPGGSLGGGGNGNTTLNLTAPTSGPYSGILIYEDPNNTNTISLNGTPVANLTGIIYAPSAELDLSGNTTMNLTTDLIVESYDKGNATINITDYTKTFGGPLTTIALAE